MAWEPLESLAALLGDASWFPWQCADLGWPGSDGRGAWVMGCWHGAEEAGIFQGGNGPKSSPLGSWLRPPAGSQEDLRDRHMGMARPAAQGRVADGAGRSATLLRLAGRGRLGQLRGRQGGDRHPDRECRFYSTLRRRQRLLGQVTATEAPGAIGIQGLGEVWKCNRCFWLSQGMVAP